MEAMSRDGEADEAAKMSLGGDLSKWPLGAPELWQTAQQQAGTIRSELGGLTWHCVQKGRRAGVRGLTFRAALTFHAGDGGRIR